MNLQELKKLYRQDNKTVEIIAGLQGNRACNIHLKGITGSAGAFIASAISSKYPKTYLFVLSDKEEAAYFLNDMENLSGGNSVLFFPTSYKHSHQAGKIDKANVLLRAEVLNRINSPPPNCLTERQPPPPKGGDTKTPLIKQALLLLHSRKRLARKS